MPVSVPVTGCLSRRYKGFRDVEGHAIEFYWQLLCVRLLFVILFEVRRSVTFINDNDN